MELLICTRQLVQRRTRLCWISFWWVSCPFCVQEFVSFLRQPRICGGPIARLSSCCTVCFISSLLSISNKHQNLFYTLSPLTEMWSSIRNAAVVAARKNSQLTIWSTANGMSILSSLADWQPGTRVEGLAKTIALVQ